MLFKIILDAQFAKKNKSIEENEWSFKRFILVKKQLLAFFVLWFQIKLDFTINRFDIFCYFVKKTIILQTSSINIMASESIAQEDILPEQILQAASQLFLKHGLKKVTMDDVSRLIGKSRSSLYYYYKNRDEIFEAVMDALIHEVVDEMAEAVKNAVSVEEKIRAFCLTKVKTSEDKKAFFSSMEAGMDAEEISWHNQIMSDVHKRLMAAESSLLKTMFSAGVKSGEIRKLKPKELDSLIFILLSGIRGIRREMRYENDFSKLGTSVDTLTAIIMSWLKQ
jgi:AcrR family transcriptional regulator